MRVLAACKFWYEPGQLFLSSNHVAVPMRGNTGLIDIDNSRVPFDRVLE